MDTRFPKMVNNFLKEKKTDESSQPLKRIAAAKVFEQTFLPLQKKAEEKQKELTSYAEVLAESCVEHAKNKNLKQALEEYNSLKAIIEGQEETTRLFIIKQGRIGYLSPKKGYQKVSLFVEIENRHLLDSVRRKLAPIIYQKNLDNVRSNPLSLNLPQLTAAKGMIHDILHRTLDDKRLLSSIYFLISAYYETTGEYNRQLKYSIVATEWLNHTNAVYRSDAQQYYQKGKTLEYGNQAAALDNFKKAETAFNKIQNKTSEDEKLQTECAFQVEKSQVQEYAQSRYTLYHAIDGGTVPENVKEKFLAIPNSHFKI